MSAPAAELAARWGLPRLGQRPPLGLYLRQLWQRRHFTLELSRATFRAGTEADRLGVAWVVIRPLISAVVYGTVFGLLLPSGSRPENFVPFLVTGVFLFQFFAGSLNDGAKAITGNLGLVRTVRFPRAILVTSKLLEQVYALFAMVVVLLVLVVGFGELPGLSWLQLPLVLVLFVLFDLGVGFIVARATIHVRDITQLLPFLTRLMFYLSGIFYSLDRVVTEPVLLTILQSNPVHIYISLARGAILDGLPAPLWMWGAGTVWALGTLVGGFLYFWQAEERYGRE